MKTYAERAGYIPAEKIAIFQRMAADVKAMPDLDPADLASCHAVCRALELRHKGARCVDGWFGGVGQEHSWMDLGEGIVADMYPIAGITPFLVDASHWMSPWNRFYTPKPDLLHNARLGLVHHEQVARRLLDALAEHDLQP